jgi:hypothetical protein
MIGPEKSPIAIVKLFSAEAISFALNSSIFLSTFLIFLDKATNPGINTGALPRPIKKNPKMIDIILLGIGGHGTKKSGLIDVRTSPKVTIR